MTNARASRLHRDPADQNAAVPPIHDGMEGEPMANDAGTGGQGRGNHKAEFDCYAITAWSTDDQEHCAGYLDGRRGDNPLPNDNRHPRYVHSFLVGRAEREGSPLQVKAIQRSLDELDGGMATVADVRRLLGDTPPATPA